MVHFQMHHSKNPSEGEEETFMDPEGLLEYNEDENLALAEFSQIDDNKSHNEDSILLD